MCRVKGLVQSAYFCVLLLSQLIPTQGLSQTVTVTPSHPFFVKLSELEAKPLSSPTEPIYAVSCGATRSVLSQASVVPRKPLSQESLPFKLDQTGYYLKDAYSLIELTHSGKDVVSRFQRLNETGEITITQITSEGQTRCPKGAAACYVPVGKTMYIDKSAELGILAPILFHEILHALDAELEVTLLKVMKLQTLLEGKSEGVLNVLSQKLHLGVLELQASAFTERDMEDVVRTKVMATEILEVERFKTERIAYDGAFPVETELVELFPAYYEASMRKIGYRIPHNFSDNEIISRYALNEIIVQKYLRNNCQALPPL